jgi:hypothetical protein
MQKTIIPSSYDDKVVWIFPVVFLTLLFVLYVSKVDLTFVISIGLIFLLAIGASLVLIPYQIYRDDIYLVFKRLVGDVVILISDIEKIEQIEFSSLQRNLGIDGLLGYYGSFTLIGFGKVNVMAKSKINLVLIHSKGEPLVVSVDDVTHLQDL